MIPRRLSAGSRSPTSSGFERARRSFSRRRERQAAALIPGRQAPRRSASWPSAAGIAAEWTDISGKRTIVSPETKIALLSGLGLEVASEAQARDSLTRLIDETQRRRLPFSLVLRADQPLVAPLRDMPQASRGADRARRRRRRRMVDRGCRRRSGATWRTDAPSPSAQSRCRRCRSAATVSLSMASNAR